MEAASTSEMSVNFYRTTCYNSEDNCLKKCVLSFYYPSTDNEIDEPEVVVGEMDRDRGL
jgi:hypothetical protein